MRYKVERFIHIAGSGRGENKRVALIERAATLGSSG